MGIKNHTLFYSVNRSYAIVSAHFAQYLRVASVYRQVKAAEKRVSEAVMALCKRYTFRQKPYVVSNYLRSVMQGG